MPCGHMLKIQQRGCSGNRVWWFTSYDRLLYYIILPTSIAPPSDCTPFDEYPYATVSTLVGLVHERWQRRLAQNIQKMN